MGDLVDLAGAKIIHEELKLEARQQRIATVLEEVAAVNDRRGLRLLAIAWVGSDGCTETRIEGAQGNVTTLLGVLAILKHDIMADTRVPVDDTPETPDA